MKERFCSEVYSDDISTVVQGKNTAIIGKDTNGSQLTNSRKPQQHPSLKEGNRRDFGGTSTLSGQVTILGVILDSKLTQNQQFQTDKNGVIVLDDGKTNTRKKLRIQYSRRYKRKRAITTIPTVTILLDLPLMILVKQDARGLCVIYRNHYTTL